MVESTLEFFYKDTLLKKVTVDITVVHQIIGTALYGGIQLEDKLYIVSDYFFSDLDTLTIRCNVVSEQEKKDKISKDFLDKLNPPFSVGSGGETIN